MTQSAGPARRMAASGRPMVLLTALLAVAACSSGTAPPTAELAAVSRAAASPTATPPTATPPPATAPPTTAPATLPSATPTTAPATPPTATPPPAPTVLPRGGRSIFPRHVVVMAYGTAQTPVLGVLGEGTPAQAAARAIASAKAFERPAGRVSLPAFELITTVAQRSAGADGAYSGLVSDADVQRYLDAAVKAKLLLVLDFQPGRADLLQQVRRYEKFLLHPSVGVALDPEWVLRPGQRPGRQIGSLDAVTVNRVSSYLANLTLKNRLPEKLLLVHQFQARMLPDRAAIVDRPGLALVFHVDGFGSRSQKLDTYRALAVRGPVRGGTAHNGFKLFLDEDVGLMSPTQVMGLVPRPELVSYQ